MNSDRRKILEGIKTKFTTICETLRSVGNEFDDLKNDLETVRDEEQDYFDAMPVGFQEGEKGERATSAVDAMQEAITLLEGVIENIESNDETEFFNNIDIAKE